MVSSSSSLTSQPIPIANTYHKKVLIELLVNHSVVVVAYQLLELLFVVSYVWLLSLYRLWNKLLDKQSKEIHASMSNLKALRLKQIQQR